MNLTCFILPYFGKFPQYINAFFKSCQDNPDYDFIILTDNSPLSIAPNIKFITMSFQECKTLIQKKLKGLGYNNICIHKPYKLCDYKPCYGYIFSEYLQGYSFWGHMDCDLIFGKISNFTNKFDMMRYDRIFKYGHLSIYKNTLEINTRFTTEIEWCNFRSAIETTLATHFDELKINYLYKKFDFPFLEDNYSITFASNEYSYKSGSPELINYPQLFVKYPSGPVYFYWLDENSIINKMEIIYVHFMNRKDIIIDIDLDKPYLLTPIGAIIFDEKKNSRLF